MNNSRRRRTRTFRYRIDTILASRVYSTGLDMPLKNYERAQYQPSRSWRAAFERVYRAQKSAR